MVTQKISFWRFQPSVTCPAVRLWEHQEEFILPYLVVHKGELEVCPALCRLLVGWRGKMQEKVSPADGEMRMGVLYLSSSGNRITVDCTEGQGSSGSKSNRERMINSWRQERKTEMLRQTGRDKIKTICRHPLVSSWLCGGLFVVLCFSPVGAELLCSLSNQRCLVLPHIPRHRPCPAPCPVQQPLFNSCWSGTPGCQTAAGN